MVNSSDKGYVQRPTTLWSGMLSKISINIVFMIAFSVYFMPCKYTKSQLYTQDYKVKKHYIVTKMPL